MANTLSKETRAELEEANKNLTGIARALKVHQIYDRAFYAEKEKIYGVPGKKIKEEKAAKAAKKAEKLAKKAAKAAKKAEKAKLAEGNTSDVSIAKKSPEQVQLEVNELTKACLKVIKRGKQNKKDDIKAFLKHAYEIQAQLEAETNMSLKAIIGEIESIYPDVTQAIQNETGNKAFGTETKSFGDVMKENSAAAVAQPAM